MSYKGTPASSQIIWLEQRVEQLTSGPGGIMEMKQTIADKDAEIERLNIKILELIHGTKRLTWTENYGQGSEPWLKDVK